jgi:hypothetical protein
MLTSGGATLMYMLVMVLDDSAHLNDVLSAWEQAGVHGVTILESTGVYRVLRRHHTNPAFAGFATVFGGGRTGNNTLFAVIESLDIAENAVTQTQAVIGSLHEPDTGIVFVLPIAQTWGINQYDASK